MWTAPASSRSSECLLGSISGRWLASLSAAVERSGNPALAPFWYHTWICKKNSPPHWLSTVIQHPCSEWASFTWMFGLCRHRETNKRNSDNRFNTLLRTFLQRWRPSLRTGPPLYLRKILQSDLAARYWQHSCSKQEPLIPPLTILCNVGNKCAWRTPKQKVLPQSLHILEENQSDLFSDFTASGQQACVH